MKEQTKIIRGMKSALKDYKNGNYIELQSGRDRNNKKGDKQETKSVGEITSKSDSSLALRKEIIEKENPETFDDGLTRVAPEGEFKTGKKKLTDAVFIMEQIKKIEKAMAEMYFEQKRLKGIVEELKQNLEKLQRG